MLARSLTLATALWQQLEVPDEKFRNEQGPTSTPQIAPTPSERIARTSSDQVGIVTALELCRWLVERYETDEWVRWLY